MSLRSRVGLALLIGALASGSALAWVVQQRFDHWQHRALFPTCVGCHAGAAEPGAALWPAPASCAECHDNAVQKAVEWTPRAGPRASNLKFTHGAHADAVRRGRDVPLRWPDYLMMFVGMASAIAGLALFFVYSMSV